MSVSHRAVARQNYSRGKADGGEAGIRTLGRTLKALQRFSKPPPSASRPPHRAGMLSINEIAIYGLSNALSIVPETVPASPEDWCGTPTLHTPGALIRRQRFFSSPTMPTTPLLAPVCSNEPASSFLDERASRTCDAGRLGTRTRCRKTPVLSTAAEVRPAAYLIASRTRPSRPATPSRPRGTPRHATAAGGGASSSGRLALIRRPRC